MLADLRDRLARTRLLPDSPRQPASGMSRGYLRELVAVVARVRLARARQAWLNAHPQFLADVGDTTLHFVHRRAERDDAPALLIMHGWPHLFSLQLDFADLLPDFHVVVPSLPGFAFSTPYADGPITEARLAATMHALMTEVLGYDRYLTYGEDVSANVNDLIAAHLPGPRRRHHRHPRALSVARRARGAHRPRRARVLRRPRRGARHRTAPTGTCRRTRPDTLAAALNDSPAGLLAWLAEKLVEWSDTPAGDPRAVERRISRERILTEAMIYWVTQSDRHVVPARTTRAPTSPAPIPPVEVPAAVFIQRHEGDYPESLARGFYRDLRVFERLAEGGHFTIAEVPAAMAERTRAFARELGLLLTGRRGVRPRDLDARAAAGCRHPARGSRGRPRADPSIRRRRAADRGTGRRSRA